MILLSVLDKVVGQDRSIVLLLKDVARTTTVCSRHSTVQRRSMVKHTLESSTWEYIVRVCKCITIQVWQLNMYSYSSRLYVLCSLLTRKSEDRLVLTNALCQRVRTRGKTRCSACLKHASQNPGLGADTVQYSRLCYLYEYKHNSWFHGILSYSTVQYCIYIVYNMYVREFTDVCG